MGQQSRYHYHSVTLRAQLSPATVTAWLGLDYCPWPNIQAQQGNQFIDWSMSDRALGGGWVYAFSQLVIIGPFSGWCILLQTKQSTKKVSSLQSDSSCFSLKHSPFCFLSSVLSCFLLSIYVRRAKVESMEKVSRLVSVWVHLTLREYRINSAATTII